MTDGGTPNGRGQLQVYLLGSLAFDAAVRLPRTVMAYQLSSRDAGGALILCEHPPLVTVGRHGSPAHLRVGPEELAVRGWPLRWVSRSRVGIVLHLPGQLAVYPVLPLAGLGLDVPGYLGRLHQALVALLDEFGIRGETRPDQPGVSGGVSGSSRPWAWRCGSRWRSGAGSMSIPI